tara:strand:- start:2765 stop:3385 length:621 start_codon:yes stop_codon:yes gene_type:complete
MKYRYLLLLRYSLVNAVGLVFILVVYSQGYLNKAIKSDVTNVVVLIIFIFLIGLMLSSLKAFWISRELNHAYSLQKKENSLLNDFIKKSKKLDASSRSNLISSTRINISVKISNIKFIANILVILGLIGTVIGFIIALSGVDGSVSSNPDEVGKMVASLVQGMSVALYTTLAGSILSVWLNICYQILSNGANRLISRIIEVGEKNL